MRFLRNAHIAPTRHADICVEELIDKIVGVLQEVNRKENLPEAIFSGLLGNEEDGAYPGKFGKVAAETGWDFILIV